MNHPSHVVLFNFRRGAEEVVGWGINVSGRRNNAGAVDGVQHFVRILEDAENYGVQEVKIPKKVVLIGIIHEDFSSYTKPKTRDNYGTEKYQVSEQSGYWIVSSLKQGCKKPRLDAVGQSVVIVKMQGTGEAEEASDEDNDGARGGERGGGDGGGGEGGGGARTA